MTQFMCLPPDVGNRSLRIETAVGGRKHCSFLYRGMVITAGNCTGTGIGTGTGTGNYYRREVHFVFSSLLLG